MDESIEIDSGISTSSRETNSALSTKELAERLGLPFRESFGSSQLPKNLIRGDLDRIAGSWAKQHQIVPIGEVGGCIMVASAAPINVAAISQLRLCYGRPVQLIMTTPEEIKNLINAMRTQLMSDRSAALSNNTSSDDEEFINQIKIDVTDSEGDDAPIIRYVNAIIFKASEDRASDVHIEPYEAKVKVRFRIDGVLYDVSTEEKRFQASITSRVKVMSGLNIAEKRLPQDGRIGLKIAGREVDIRVSTIPTQFGERIVMRLLDKSAMVVDLEQLGIAGENLRIVERLIEKPNGIILVTGPTGSGKTTTLYSCLSRINTPELNILTVEDPIEYQLEGIGQMQVNPKIGFTFASGLRAILRQDPDVVMVGEIRDAETAEIAIQASLTGHLVFSTLHTNDSAGAITRLIDMGIEPFLVSSSLLGIMAQRLVRRLCPDCKESYMVPESRCVELGLEPELFANRAIFGTGSRDCTTCQNTRYLGRSGIHELLLVDDALRSLILQRLDSVTIRNEAQKRGFRTLRQDGAIKVQEGVTSLEEILLATHEDASDK